MKILILSYLLFICNLNFAQKTELYTPLNIKTAYDQGTRSTTGEPGKNYWQNKADYKMDLQITPSTRNLSGKESITYYNNSPDTLKEILVHLFPNLYKRGAPKDFSIDPSDEGDGVKISFISVNSTEYDISPKSKEVAYSNTYFQINLKKLLLPGSSMELKIDWNYQLNKDSEVRTGTIDSTSFFFAYFFPHIAVYDDIDGWNSTEYTGQYEFYHDFSSFDVNIFVPHDYVVWATGRLNNPDEVLTEKYLKRYNEALTSDKIIKIIDSLEYQSKSITKSNEQNKWNFKAENVTDFAFGMSDHFLWDAVSYKADSFSERRVLIEAAYLKTSNDYYKVAWAAQKVIEYMSTILPGVPYPFPSMTVFNGKSAMEYPMMVNDASQPDSSMPGLTAHEVSHSYFPFYMGINETKYAWMDEGWAAFFDYIISSNVFGNDYIINRRIAAYSKYAGKDLEMPVYSISKYLRTPVYRNNAYIKGAIFYLNLKELWGDELFKKALKEFIHRWNGKHPIPHDYFNTLINVSGEDLNWLIHPWFFEFGFVDLAITSVKSENNKSLITIENRGGIPVFIKLKIEYTDGETETVSRHVDIWETGSPDVTIELRTSKKIKSVRFADPYSIDADRTNDIFILENTN